MEEIHHAVSSRERLSALCRTGLMAAVTCILAPMTIPIGPVPISLTNLVVYLSLYLLGWKLATTSILVYLMIGASGLPVFSGFTGGIGKLVGPTGGYLMGFVVIAVVSGMIVDRCSSRVVHFLGLVGGTALCYVMGTAWFCYVTDSTVGSALGLCVFPFIPLDLVKIALAIALGPVIRTGLVKSGLIPTGK